eukprot:2923254-Prymnesium_polylepis.3
MFSLLSGFYLHVPYGSSVLATRQLPTRNSESLSLRARTSVPGKRKSRLKPAFRKRSVRHSSRSRPSLRGSRTFGALVR